MASKFAFWSKKRRVAGSRGERLSEPRANLVFALASRELPRLGARTGNFPRPSPARVRVRQPPASAMLAVLAVLADLVQVTSMHFGPTNQDRKTVKSAT